jgi:cell wall-associated NlpC family hydrolase
MTLNQLHDYDVARRGACRGATATAAGAEPMSPRLWSATALALPLFLPNPAAAQFRIPITISDVDRAVRIVRTARDVAVIGGVVSDAVRRGGVSDAARRGGASDAGVGSVSATRRARAAVTTGSHYLGVPYVWGGTTPNGFDCSGFVQYVYRKNGVPLPRTSRQMAHAGQRVTARLSSLREGDLMLFRGRDGVIDHVALYAGRDRILHSSSSGHGVRFDDLWSRRGAYFRSHLVAARRVTGSGPALMAAVERIMREFPFDHYDLPDDAPPPRR